MKNSIIMSVLLMMVLFKIDLAGQSNWELIKSSVDVDLRKVVYLDSLHLWAVGDSGTIIFSSNQGISWQTQSSNLQNGIEDLFFLNEDFGWALSWTSDGVNYQSQILSTTNGGITWQTKDYRIPNVLLKTIFFFDSFYGWVGGDPFEFAHTDNGGLSWTSVNMDTSAQAFFPVSQIRFSSRQFGFAVGGAIDFAGVAWSTNDSGETWKGYLVAPDIFGDFIFLDSLNILSLSADIEGIYPIGILKYNLQNNVWDYVETSLYGRVTAIVERTDSEFWATIDNDFNFLLSKDKGVSWELIPTPDSMFVLDIAFADSSKGFAVGANGYVFKYIPKDPSSIDGDDKVFLPGKIILEQNYPNPFNPSTKIKFTIAPPNLPKGEDLIKVALNVYDVLGNEVTELLNEYKSAGNYEVEFTANERLPSGVFFYRLTAGNYSITKKMLLLR